MSVPGIKPPITEPAIRVVVMPRDANAQGTIFGGVILSYIDQAGFVECCRQAPHRYVTIAMDQVEFHEPVHVGDIVSFYAQTERVGRTSISISVTVKADRLSEPQVLSSITVTNASLVYVAVDEQQNPIPVLGDQASA